MELLLNKMGKFSITELLIGIIILIVSFYVLKGFIGNLKRRSEKSNKSNLPIIYIITGLILGCSLMYFLVNRYVKNDDSGQIDTSSLPTSPKQQTVDEYEASIPIESVQSPLYARYAGNCFIICRTEDNARLCTEHIDHKAHFIEDIETAISGGETTHFINTIWKNGSGVKFSFNGMSYDLTKRQCERLIYDFEHPKQYLGH
jgi:hypothetical protein